MESLEHTAGRLDSAAAEVVAAVRALAGLDPGAGAFAAAAPGRLGELGRALHVQWGAALAGRDREAGAVAARLAETATTLRTVRAGYAVGDDAARRRLASGDR